MTQSSMAATTAWLKAPFCTKGLDPLGVQAPCIHIYGQLMPGITNVTNRARYFSFYPWLLWKYDQLGRERTYTEVSKWIRRADILFTMIGVRHRRSFANDDPVKHDAALIGVDTLVPIVADLGGHDTVRLSVHATTEKGSARYFMNPLGGLGQYYLGNLAELGIMGRNGTIPGYTPLLGTAIAEAFDAGVDGRRFIDVLDGDVVTAAQLDELAEFCPCQLPLAKDDLGFIVDLLIHQLGLGIQGTGDALEHPGPSEEEQIGADDEHSPSEPPDTGELLKVCHGKVRLLTRRMSKQLQRALSGECTPATTVQQLLAVLAVLREVRRHDVRLGLTIQGESLVPVVRRCELLDASIAALFERKHGVYAAALEALRDDPDGDLSRLRGLLIWLAWDAGLDGRRQPSLTETGAELHARMEEKAKLLALLQVVVHDDEACEEARQSIWTTAPAADKANAALWLTDHVTWGEAIVARYRERSTWAVGLKGFAHHLARGVEPTGRNGRLFE